MMRDSYISKENWQQIATFSEEKETPFLVVRLGTIKEKYEELKVNFPYSKIHYAI